MTKTNKETMTTQIQLDTRKCELTIKLLHYVDLQGLALISFQWAQILTMWINQQDLDLVFSSAQTYSL